MIGKLTTAEAIRLLLDGGYIAEICLKTCKTRKYEVHERKDSWGEPHVGFSPHITPKQFAELIGAGVICATQESRTSEYGDVYNFYKIVLERKG